MPLHYIHYQLTTGEPDDIWDDKGLSHAWVYYDRDLIPGGIKRYTQDDVINRIKDITREFDNMSPVALNWAMGRVTVWGEFLYMLVNANADTMKPQEVLYIKYPKYDI
jgi:hypothetical protein